MASSFKTERWNTIRNLLWQTKVALGELATVARILAMVYAEDPVHIWAMPRTDNLYNGPKNSDTKGGQNKVVKCHHAKTLF